MTTYPDASLIVSAFSDEAASSRSREWLGSLAPGELIASKWCETEVASALALKVRIGALRPADRTLTRRAVRDMLVASAKMIEVQATHFDRASDLIDHPDINLRGGDALHLAIAAAANATLWTLDRRMANAGRALGLDVQLLI